ncbi:MAG: TatD family hydrolase [Shewanella sp.]|nr:TatD family hydrolase [Shewanella sp.]MCF1431423.1 TatD family hydrolase [Shewanella sp.]MCF1438402.1 TatD family hydrolase [Shewanella sp.]MCF1458657.1 TatD family hydrolase [Shewanella sp.]
MLIDTHAHLDFPEFDSDRQELFAQMHQAGLSGAIIPAADPACWERVRAVASQYACHYALGVHPWWVTSPLAEEYPAKLSAILGQSKNRPGLVAIGETGLDSVRGPALEIQLASLRRHIELAISHDLPLILHCVKAQEPLLDELAQYPASRGVVHGFGGSLETARQFARLGFKIGIGASILNTNMKKLRHCVANMEIAALLPETDSPAMAPRGISRNTPLILLRVVEEIARLRHCGVVPLKEQLFRNTTQLFDV